jgi:hypothetical protein
VVVETQRSEGAFVAGESVYVAWRLVDEMVFA